MSTLEFQQHLLGLRQQLYYFALSLTRDREAAQDLLQESTLRALTFKDKFRTGTNLKAWLYTIMKNTFINEHRRNKRTAQVMDSVEKERHQVRVVQQPESPENRIRMAEIQKSLSRLDPIYREPFLMHFEGFKYQEVADKLDLPIGTVKSRIFQARKRLMHMLTDQHQAL